MFAGARRPPDEIPPLKNRNTIRRASFGGYAMLLRKGFNSTKGFGFIQPDNGGADVFVHISAVERAGMREIVEGQKISFELERDSKSGKMSAGQLRAA